MKKIFISIIFSTIFLLQSSVIAVEGAQNNAKTLSLADCIEKSFRNSPVLKRQKLNYELSKKQLNVAKSTYFPTLSAGTGYDISKSKSGSLNNTHRNYSIDTSLKQLIWDFGRTSANIKMERFNQITAMYDYENAIYETIFDVKIKYYTLMAAMAAVEVDKANLQINERNYQRTKAYYDEGLKSKIDLVNAEVYLSDSKIALVQTINAQKSALISLNNAMYLAYEPNYDFELPQNFQAISNLTPASLTDITKAIDDFLLPPANVENATLTAQVEKKDFLQNFKFEKYLYSFEKCVEMANQNRHDLKAYTSTLNAMEQYFLTVKKRYYPELSAKAGYGYNNNSSSGSGHNPTTFENGNSTNSFSFSLNLSSSINILSQKNEAEAGKLQIELAKNEVDLLKQNIYFEVQEAFVNMLESEEKIPLLGQKVQQTLENLELADGRYSVGLGDYIELQDAKVNYNNAQHAFIKGVFDYNVAKAKLEKTIAVKQDFTIIEDE